MKNFRVAKVRARLVKGLSKNIKNFNMIMASRMEVHKLVQIGLFLDLRSMVVAIWPSATVRVFGSCITGTFF